MYKKKQRTGVELGWGWVELGGSGVGGVELEWNWGETLVGLGGTRVELG